MGTYTDLSIGGYPLFSTKGDVVPEIMTMFRERDRVEIKLLGPDWPPMIWGAPDPEFAIDESAIVYRCSLTEAVDRLNVMGFTMQRIKADFEAIRESELEATKEQHGTWARSERRRLRSLSFAMYTEGLRVPGCIEQHPNEFAQLRWPGPFARRSRSPRMSSS
jgi:hypothetical protein